MVGATSLKVHRVKYADPGCRSAVKVIHTCLIKQNYLASVRLELELVPTLRPLTGASFPPAGCASSRKPS